MCRHDVRRFLVNGLRHGSSLVMLCLDAQTIVRGVGGRALQPRVWRSTLKTQVSRHRVAVDVASVRYVTHVSCAALRNDADKEAMQYVASSGPAPFARSGIAGRASGTEEGEEQMVGLEDSGVGAAARCEHDF